MNAPDRGGTDAAAMEPLPVRMLSEYAYCPRLFHLMHVDGRWDDNLYTEEGRAVHDRVDHTGHNLPEPCPVSQADGKDGDPPAVASSVMLSSPGLNLVGKLDLVETRANMAVPVEFKRGSPPAIPGQCWEPERVQLMAQGLLLREHGYTCDHGILYFAAARTRVAVAFTPELESRTRELLDEALAHLQAPLLPDPLTDSPKCNGCSLAAICLPDETALLNKPAAPASVDLRRLYPARDDAVPLYVQEQGARVGKEGTAITVSRGGTLMGRFLLKDISQVVLCGNIAITAQALHLLCEKGIPVVHVSMSGWFYGITHGHGLRNAYDRAAQFVTASDRGRSLAFARALVYAKVRNQRTLLRRNAGSSALQALRTMRRLASDIGSCESAETLLGLEGSVAACYFSHFSRMLKQDSVARGFDFQKRNRRPPRDPVNAMLSFSYAMLAKECTVSLVAEGLDPWWGLYHRPRHGRPALALDLMEEFRPLVADSAVLTAINTGMVSRSDFACSSAGCLMRPRARKSLIQAYEQRLDHLITHPLFDYRCSWRTVIRLQSRLLARWFRGDVPAYTGIMTR